MEKDIRWIQRFSNYKNDLLLPYKFDISSFEQIDNPQLVDHIGRVGIEFYLRQQWSLNYNHLFHAIL